MLIKAAKYKKIKVFQNQCITEAVYGCDHCGKEIPEFPNEPYRLELTIFYQNNESKHEHLCSWACVLKRLLTVKSDHFISLPFVHFDADGKRSAKELVGILKRIK